MKKRVLRLFALALVMFSLVQVHASAEGTMYDSTVRLVEDTFRYLDEIYLRQYPELGLRFTYGTVRDREELAALADSITADCATDLEKAEAVNDWLAANIYYEVGASAFPNDTYRTGEGNCLSYALLMQTLLRLEGIPAVMGDGWRGDMTTATSDLFGTEGHAWCFAHVGGEWVLYDPLWLADGTTDRDYMAKNMYFGTVEFICPVYDSQYMPPHGDNTIEVYYIDGLFRIYENQEPSHTGNLTKVVNNVQMLFTPNNSTEDSYSGWIYMDGRDTSGMVMGELYRDGWVCNGELAWDNFSALHYHYENGLQPTATTMEFRGETVFIDIGTVYRVHVPEGQYEIRNGLFTIAPGYVGRVIEPYMGTNALEEGDYFVWESRYPDVATVDEKGVVTALKNGVACLILEHRSANGGLSGRYSIEIKVSDGTDDRGKNKDIMYTGSLDVQDDHCVYNGQPQYPVITLSREGWVLQEGVHYEIEYLDDNINAGRMDFVLHGIGEYYGTWESCFYIHKAQHSVEYTYPDSALRVGDEVQLSARSETGTPAFSVDDPNLLEVSADGKVKALRWGSAELILTLPETENYEALEIRIPVEIAASHDPTPEDPAPPYIPGQPDPEPDPDPEPKPEPVKFGDVADDAYYAGAVSWAVNNGITNGTGGNLFSPDLSCIRAQVVTFLWRAQGCPEPESLISPFRDVQDPSAYYYKAVLWAVEQGITTGTGGGLFSPEAECTRAQVVTFLWRASGEEESVWGIEFSDVAPDQYYTEAVSWAVEHSITHGMGLNRFEPDTICNRAQIVTFLFRHMR